MATTAQNFIFQNYKSGLDGATFTAIPFVQGLERSRALAMTGRIQGGAAGAAPDLESTQQAPWVINTQGIAMLDDVIAGMDNDGLAKHGVFHVTTASTTAVNIDLTNLVTNATSSYGDTSFAKWNKLVAFNLSGLDGVAAADMTLAPGASNGNAMLLGGTTPTLTIPASSPCVLMSKAGITVDSTHKILTVTPSAGGNFVLCVAGS